MEVDLGGENSCAMSELETGIVHIETAEFKFRTKKVKNLLTKALHRKRTRSNYLIQKEIARDLTSVVVS
jgi:hypothetical protein